MKRRIAALAAACLLLGGCALTEGNYVSITPHLEQRNPEQQESIRATNYTELCTALTDLVDSGAASGIISVSDYASDKMDQHMEQAVQYVCDTYPTGAYAVEKIQYEFGISGGQDAYAVTISYRRSPAELSRIRTASTTEELKKAVYDALEQCDSTLVLDIPRYTRVDLSLIVEDYAQRNPNIVIEVPEVSVGFYPESGMHRIAEIRFTYQTPRDSLRMMQQRVQALFDAAKLYVDTDAQEHEKFVQLYAFLTERYHYKVETSLTPAYSLLCHGVGDSRAFAMVYAAMCRSADLECVSVSGTRDGESWSWNILRDDGVYYHVDLLRSMEGETLRELADSEMAGYVWDYSAYPSCGPAPEPETSEPTEAAEDGL